MRVVARINKYVENPVQPLWAPWARHTAVIEQRGRKSGRRFTLTDPRVVSIDAPELPPQVRGIGDRSRHALVGALSRR
jgi:hypothetical protein